jgi:arginine decarboxylase
MQTMVQTPNSYFFVKGTSEGLTKLNSFDKALINSGVGDTNLIRLSSIVPPACEEIKVCSLPGGALIPIAYASLTSDNPGEMISAAVAIGIPEDETQPGVIMEYSAVSEAKPVEDMARKMVIEGFRYRNRALKEVKSIVITTKVESIATVFAGIVLWYK